jgi:hypothetical protein
MNNLADSLLDRAAALLPTVRRNHRDGMVEVGNVLHDYVRVRVGSPPRFQDRVRAVSDAAARLGLSRQRVIQLLHTAAVVRVLGPPGAMTFSPLQFFQVLLVRAPHYKSERDCRDRPEVWELREEYAAWAPGVYARAAREGWDAKAVRSVVFSRTKLRGRPGRPRKPDGSSLFPPDSLLSMARRATPADLADLIYTLVLATDDPNATASTVTTRLSQVKAQPRRLSLAGAFSL